MTGTRILRVALASALLAPGSFLLAQQPLDTRYIDYVPAVGLEYGAGYDPTTLAVKPEPCIEFQEPSSTWGPGSGQSVTSDIILVDSARDVSDELGISYTESMGGGIFKESMNAKMVNELKISTHTVTYVAHAKVSDGRVVELKNPTLKTSPVNYQDLIRNNYAEFRRRCGDYFVKGFAPGGEYLGTVSIETRSLEDKNEIQVTFSEKLQAGIANEEMSAEIKNKFALAMKDRRVTVTESRKGGAGVHIATDVDGMLANFRSFASDVNSASFFYRVILVPYSVLSEADTADVQETAELLEQLGRRYQDYRMVWNDVVYMLGHPKEFIRPDVPKLQGWETALRASLADMRTAMKACGTGLGACRDAVARYTKTAEDYVAQYPKRIPSTRVADLWTRVDGSLAQIHSGSRDFVWGVDAAGKIWRWNGSAFALHPASCCLSQVAVAADGTAWGVNSAGSVHTLAGGQWAFVSISPVWATLWEESGQRGASIMITGHVGDLDSITSPRYGSTTPAGWSRRANSWRVDGPNSTQKLVLCQLPGCQGQTTVTYAGGVSNMPAPPIRQPSGEWGWHWNYYASAVFDFDQLRQIAVGHAGAVWGINGHGQVFLRNPNETWWTAVSLANLSRRWDQQLMIEVGGLSNIAVGRDGTVWGIGGEGPGKPDYRVFRWKGDAWELMSGALKQISVGSSARIWGIDKDGQVVRWTGKEWEAVGGDLTSVTVAHDGTVWGLNGQGEVFRYAGAAP